jgi:hypothetical protein
MANNFGQNKAGLPEQAAVVQVLTTGANATFTAQIEDAAEIVQLTSGGATEYAVLPKATADRIGRQILIVVGANGYELVTPSASGDTINAVDSDGTNQLDVAASTTLLCIQNSATGWIAIAVAAATITVVAPDND